MPTAPSNQAPMKQRVLGAGLWTLAGYAVAYPIRLGSSLITTRLLAPEMFGVIAIAMLVMTALAHFSDVGLAPNIIKSERGGDPDFLNAAWSIQIIRSFLVSLLGLCISGGTFRRQSF